MQNKPHHVKTVEEAILQPSALYGFGNALDPSPLHVQKSSGSRLPAKKAFPLSCKMSRVEVAGAGVGKGCG